MYREARWMYRYAKCHWLSICFYIGAGILGTCMGLGGSVASKHLIDAVIGMQAGKILPTAAAMMVLALGNVGAGALISRISARINVMVQNEIQADIYNKIIYTDWESLHEFRSGDLLNRLSGDVRQVASSVIGWIPNLITKAVQFIGALVIILAYDPVMAGLALLSAPVSLILSRVLVKRMRDYSKEMREISSNLMSFQNDTFQNLQTIKAFGLTDLFREQMEGMQEHYKEKMLDYNKFSVYTSSFMSVMGLVVSYACFGWSIYRLWSGYITTGTLLLFLQMAGALSSSFSSLVNVIPSAINAATCAGRLMAVSEMEKEQIPDAGSVKGLKNQKETGLSVELKQVDIIYKEGNQVLCQGNFRAGCGEIVAIAGPSGEGKTTLVRILLGLIYPTRGSAELIGADGFRCPISSATRELFGYVPQGNSIFRGTIAENMRMVKRNATDEEIIQALKAGCAYEFVEQMPEGINSVIGEKGGGISEGQAQRLAIARAMLRDAPVLLLDEATSALDVEMEEQILKNIMAFGKNKTCIVTTHRPGVLSMSNHIYEIRDNRLEKIK